MGLEPVAPGHYEMVLEGAQGAYDMDEQDIQELPELVRAIHRILVTGVNRFAPERQNSPGAKAHLASFNFRSIGNQVTSPIIPLHH
jgi:hypothetical protein